MIFTHLCVICVDDPSDHPERQQVVTRSLRLNTIRPLIDNSVSSMVKIQFDHQTTTEIRIREDTFVK